MQNVQRPSSDKFVWDSCEDWSPSQRREFLCDVESLKEKGRSEEEIAKMLDTSVADLQMRITELKKKYQSPETKRLNVTVQCMAVYNSSIDVPKDMSMDDAINYAKQHLNEIPIGILEYIPDSDVLDEENCDFEE